MSRGEIARVHRTVAPVDRLADRRTGPGLQSRGGMIATARAVFATMPLSERIGGAVFAVVFPLLILGFALVTP